MTTMKIWMTGTSENDKKSGSRKADNEKQSFIDACKNKGFDCYIEGEEIHITSKHDRWIIICDLKNRKPTLYHRNKSLSAYSPGSSIMFYHVQSQAPHTYHSILKYIVNHDKYANHSIVVQTKLAPEKKSKKGWNNRKHQENNKQPPEKGKKVNSRRKKIERMNYKEMIMDSMYSEDEA